MKPVPSLSACGPLQSLKARSAGIGRGGKGAPEQAAPLHWSGRRCAPTALRCSVSRPRRKTRCVRCAHYAQTVATSQKTIRAARGATSPVLLGAPEALRVLSGRAFAGSPVFFAAKNTRASARRAVPGAGDLCGGEERRTSVGARSALRRLTRRNCLSVVSAANAASFATRLKAEHHSAVGAQRRPPQHEPPAGSACRAAPEPRESRPARTAATDREQMCEPLPRFMRRGSRDARWSN